MYQDEIKSSFRQPKSVEIFDLLLRYGSLTWDQIAALLKETPTQSSRGKYLKELQEYGYLETNGRPWVFRLSCKAFLNPKTDRPNPRDVNDIKLIASITGSSNLSAKRREGRIQQQATSDNTATSKHKIGKKRKAKSNDSGSSCKRVRRSLPLAIHLSSIEAKSVLSNQDLLGTIAEYLETESILAMITKTTCPQISYDHAVQCAVATRMGKKRIEQLAELLGRGCIYTPSPIRILQLATRRGCEVCDQPTPNGLNEIGLCLCSSCRNRMIKEVKLNGESTETKHSLIRATLEDERCATIVKESKRNNIRYFVYARDEAFREKNGNMAGPLVMSLKQGPKTFDDIYEEACAKDPHRSKIHSIIKICQKFVPSLRKYNHLGIFDHKGPFLGRSESSMWKVLVHWENGEKTWQPLSHFAVDDWETCATYARTKGLLYTKGWMQFQT